MTAGTTERGGLAGALLAACLAAASAHAQPPAVQLHEGEARRAEHGAADRAHYAFDAADAGPYLLRVDQLGLDLVVAVEAPNGLVQSVNSPLFRDGSEWVLIEAPGRYSVEVRSEEHTGARGGHAVSVQRLVGSDARELAAWKAFAGGAAANFAGGETAWLRAAESYAEAAQTWQALARTREQADAVFGAAQVRYWQLYDWAASAEGAIEAAALYDALGVADARRQRAASRRRGVRRASHRSAPECDGREHLAGVRGCVRARPRAARASARRARAARQRLRPRPRLEQPRLHVLQHGRARARARLLRRCAALLGSVDEWTAEAYALQNIGVLDAEGGQLASASAAFERILELLPASNRPTGPTCSTTSVRRSVCSAIRSRRCKPSRRRSRCSRPSTTRQAKGARCGASAKPTTRLASSSSRKQYLMQALPIALETNDGRGQEAALRNLGNVAYLERDYESALDYHRRALEVAASVSDRAHLQLLIAKDLLALGRGAEAAAAAAAAAAVAPKPARTCCVRARSTPRARAQLLAGNVVEAAADLERAAAIFAGLGMRAERAEALHGLSLAARDAGRFDDALAHGDEALRELERVARARGRP